MSAGYTGGFVTMEYGRTFLETALGRGFLDIAGFRQLLTL
jgi:hypothetical protein